jgi:hypothetical protein
MNTISTSIPLKYLTNRRRKVERISFRDPYWEQRRKHQVVPDKKKEDSKRKCRSKDVYHSTD